MQRNAENRVFLKVVTNRFEVHQRDQNAPKEPVFKPHQYAAGG